MAAAAAVNGSSAVHHHLVEDQVPINDHSWQLQVIVTDMNVSRTLYVTGDLHIGGLMLKLVEQIDVSRDWSDHAMWWPAKRRWLQHTRSTLDQCGITADTYLEFTPMHMHCKVQLPDLQMIDARLDFSVPVEHSTRKLCRDLGIRYAEELSLKRYISPDILRKGLAYESDTFQGPPPLRPGEEAMGPMTLRRAAPISASTASMHGGGGRTARGTSPALSVQGQVFNANELGALPRLSTLPRGASPGPGSYAGTLGRAAPLVPSVSYADGLEQPEFDPMLVHSPRVPANRDTPVFRPQSLADKAALNRGWLDSSRSLMEQGIAEGELVLLRFKYMTFFDLNAKYDPVRINQLYEQAKWSVLFEEIDHTDEEATMFASLQLQAQLARDTPERDTPERDDVEVLLDELEANLDAAAASKRAAAAGRTDLTQVPELADYLKYMKPKKLAAFKGFKRAYFVFRETTLAYYDGPNAVNGAPLGQYSLKGAEVGQEISVAANKLHIRLQIQVAEGMQELVLKADTETQFARWLAACRLAARGKSMADAGYQPEVDSIRKLLHMQSAANGRGDANRRGHQPVQLPQDFNVEEFVSGRYVRRAKSKQALQQRIAEAHGSVRNLTSTEAKLQYVRAWQALPDHGIHYFVVRYRNSNKKAELLGVAHNRLMRMNLDNGDTTKTWRFAQMKKWHVNWEIRRLKIQFEDEDVEIQPLSADAKVVHEMIGGYIFMSLRNKEQSQQFNRELFHKLTAGWQ